MLMMLFPSSLVCESIATAASASCGVLFGAALLAVATRWRRGDRVAAAQDRFAELQQKLAALGEDARVAEAVFGEEIAGANADADALKARTRQLLQKLDGLNDEKVTLWTANEDMDRAAATLLEEDDETITMYEGRIQQLRENCGELEGAIEELAEESEVTKVELRRLHEAHIAFTEETRASFKRASDAADDRLRAEDESLADLIAEHAALSQRNDHLCSKVSEFWRDTIDALTSRYAENAETIKDFVALVEAMDDATPLREHLECLDKQRTQLDDDVDAAAQLVASVNEKLLAQR